MYRLGKLIQNIRNERGLSIAELSFGICTTKYIYMIERGERTPSIEMLHLFSKRLKYDFFSLLPYVCINDPMEIKTVVEKLYKHFQRDDVKILQALLKQYENILIKDYSSLYYTMRSYVELEKNKDVLKAEEELMKGFNAFNSDLEDIEKNFILYDWEDLQMLVQYCYVLLKSYRIDKFLKTIKPIYEYASKLDLNTLSYRFIISSSLVYIDYIFYIKKEYSVALNLASELSEKMHERSLLWLYHYLKHTEAICFYHLNNIEYFKAAKESAINYAADIDYVRLNEFKTSLDCLQTEHTDFEQNWREDVIDSVAIKSEECDVLYNSYLLKQRILVVEFIQLDSTKLYKAAINTREMLEKHLNDGETYHFVVDCRYDTNKEAILTSNKIDVFESELRTIFRKYHRRSRTFIYNEDTKNDRILKAFFDLYMLRKTKDEESEFFASSMKDALNHIAAIHGNNKLALD